MRQPLCSVTERRQYHEILLEQGGTDAKSQNPEVPIEDMKFIDPHVPLHELSHLMEQGGTAAKPQNPEMSFENTRTIFNENDFRATKQPGGYSFHYSSKFMENKVSYEEAYPISYGRVFILWQDFHSKW